MTWTERLLDIADALDEAGIPFLVMGTLSATALRSPNARVACPPKLWLCFVMAFDVGKTWSPENDPVVAMLLREEAATVHEAEARYLDSHIEDIIGLVNSPLSEAEFRQHPLIMMLFSHGSREWEDSLE